MKKLYFLFIVISFCVTDCVAQNNLYPFFKSGTSATPEEWDQNILSRDGGIIFTYPLFIVEEESKRFSAINEKYPIADGYKGYVDDEFLNLLSWKKYDLLPESFYIYAIKKVGDNLSLYKFNRKKYENEYVWCRVILHQDGKFRVWAWFSSSCGNFFPLEVVDSWEAKENTSSVKNDTVVIVKHGGNTYITNNNYYNKDNNDYYYPGHIYYSNYYPIRSYYPNYIGYNYSNQPRWRREERHYSSPQPHHTQPPPPHYGDIPTGSHGVTYGSHGTSSHGRPTYGSHGTSSHGRPTYGSHGTSSHSGPVYGGHRTR